MEVWNFDDFLNAKNSVIFFTTFGNKIREFSTFQWCMSYGVVFCPSMNKGCCTCSWLCNVKHRDMHCRLIVSLDKLARPRNC